MRDARHTHQGGTDTAEGWVPHLRILTDYGIVDAPVCVNPRVRGTRNDPALAVDEEGNRLFALPGRARMPARRELARAS